MKLVVRRARRARGLLLAAGVATLVATTMVTGLADYNRRGVEAGQREMVRAASAEERSLLISGAGGRDASEYAERDRAVRVEFADGIGGVAATVAAARYGTGRQLTGDLGAATPTGGQPAFAEMAILEDLPGHADIVTGGWPEPGGSPLRVTLPQSVATRLGLTVGARIPLTDRRSARSSEVQLTGTWRPKNAADPYWRLVPGVGEGSAASTTSHGPFVLHPDDFNRTFGEATSASWVVVPDLTALEPADLVGVKTAIDMVADEIPDRTGLGSSAQLVTQVGQLIDRLVRADLVGRSALFTPLLLIAVLAGYALMLMAALLAEDRRAETALLRARGAARWQLAGLAAREAALVVLPAAILAPPLTALVLRHSNTSGDSALAWIVAGAVAFGCLAAMLGPMLRRGGSYVAELAATSRPNRFALAQRAGLDVALVALAVLAWVQLRQYTSPLAGAGGSLGVDPLLAAAPILGVLAAAVLALRLLPPATRLAERLVHRRSWTATMLGMWQAGRRPHAGPVLLLALAVGGSTLVWSLITGWERSHVEQANHRVGADLRLTERNGAAPASRAGQLATLPGVDRALPGWRDEVRVGASNVSGTVVALDAAAAPQVVRLDASLAEEPTKVLFDRLVRSRAERCAVPLPEGTRRLTGELRTPVDGAQGQRSINVAALITTADGLAWRLPLAVSPNSGSLVTFDLTLPEAGGRQLGFAGLDVEGGPVEGRAYRLSVTKLSGIGAEGTARPLDLTGAGGWTVADGSGSSGPAVTTGGNSLDVTYPAPIARDFFDHPRVRYAIVRATAQRPVPAMVTPHVLDELNLKVGQRSPLSLPGVSLSILVVGVVDAIPAAETSPAVLLDLPAAVDWLIRDRGAVRPQPEWWLRTRPGEHTSAAEAGAALAGVTAMDRRAVAAEAARNPYWISARNGLLAAAFGAVLLALVGLTVDAWATARKRLAELAVLHTLGATPGLLVRSLLAEQAFLAGLGVTVGFLVGAGVGAAMVPSVIVTSAAGRPVPPAEFDLPWAATGATAIGLLLVALTFSAMVAAGIRQRVAISQLRLGGDR